MRLLRKSRGGTNMTKKLVTSQWTGIKAKVFAWHLDNPLARLPETLLLGDCRSAVQDEFSRLIRGNEIILDVGAGTGRFSLAVAKQLRSGKVICLDLSEEMLQHLKRKAEKECLEERIQVLKGEASASGLENESADLVMSNSVFHELSDPEEVLGEMVRVLKQGGRVIVTDFRNTKIGRLICRSHRKGSHGPFSVHELETLFTKAGLQNVKVSPARHWVIGVGQK
jgi:ubiquinone/menaquinone biosynthesis C-methylase UbiE